MRFRHAVPLLAVAASACQSPGSPAIDMGNVDPRLVPAEAQRPGDPEAGYHALVNNGYVSCGLPYSLFAQFFGPAPVEQRLPGREGRNETMPYWQTAFTTASGVEVVAANCLT